MTRSTDPIDFSKYRLRVCRYLNECALCGGNITSGQRYYDGGYNRRAHEECVTEKRWNDMPNNDQRKTYKVGDLEMRVVEDPTLPLDVVRVAQAGLKDVMHTVINVSGKCVELLGAVTRGAIAAGILVDKFLEEDLGEEERARLERLRKLLRGQGKDEDFPEWLR